MECALGRDSRIGVSPPTTVIGKEAWNRIRRQMSSAQARLMTDSQYGGPAPVRAFMTAAQRTPVVSIAGSERPAWAERYFHIRPQFSSEAGLPGYRDVCRHDRGTLPPYASQTSRELESISIPLLHSFDEVSLFDAKRGCRY